MSLLSFKFRVQVICGILELVFRVASLKFSIKSMPLTITPSKKPLPVGKRSSLRKKSYEVVPALGDMCPRSFSESKTKEASIVCVWVVAGGTVWEDCLAVGDPSGVAKSPSG